MLEALSDDLNTPAAISELHRLVIAGFDQDRGAAAFLKGSANLMGLLQQTRSERMAAAVNRAAIDPEAVERLISERSSARANRNWAESDRLRAELAALGVAIKDNKDGTTTWEPKPYELKR